ncbi:MAG: O-methyltransferase [Actinomycetota bacterium]|jgi:predicted O-methyltransferase YrrM|nr:O-methyltransferase [Actinomycetota bacterium]
MNGDDLGKLLRDVDAYIGELFAPPDAALQTALEDSQRAGLPEIHVSPSQGRLLQLLAEIASARRILEIGTLGGYSTIHFARALPDDGALISLELDERHADVARTNIERAELSDKVELRVGDARELLAALAESGVEPFDLVFIDADKEGYPEYLEWSMKLSQPGTLILGDNAIRGGGVLDPKDDSARATRQFNRMLAEDERLSSIILPILRERIDGLAIARVRA